MNTIANWLWVLCVPWVSAQTIIAQGLPASGAQSPGPGAGDNNQELAVFLHAGRHPNDTNAVSFTRVYNNSEETWTWRINVTDIAIPNNIRYLGSSSANYSEGLHVANTQWQLGWPGDSDSLQKLLEQRNSSLYVTTAIQHLPSNVTKHYSDSDNGNCTALLGANCTQSITMSALRGTAVSYGELDGCDGTVDLPGSPVDAGMGFKLTGTEPDTSLERDGTLFYLTSQPWSGSNYTIWNETVGAVQILVMDFRELSFGPHGSSSGPTVLCRIVDQKAADDASAAVQLGVPSTIALATALLGMLAVLW